MTFFSQWMEFLFHPKTAAFSMLMSIGSDTLPYIRMFSQLLRFPTSTVGCCFFFFILPGFNRSGLYVIIDVRRRIFCLGQFGFLLISHYFHRKRCCISWVVLPSMDLYSCRHMGRRSFPYRATSRIESSLLILYALVSEKFSLCCGNLPVLHWRLMHLQRLHTR